MANLQAAIKKVTDEGVKLQSYHLWDFNREISRELGAAEEEAVFKLLDRIMASVCEPSTKFTAAEIKYLRTKSPEVRAALRIYLGELAHSDLESGKSYIHFAHEVLTSTNEKIYTAADKAEFVAEYVRIAHSEPQLRGSLVYYASGVLEKELARENQAAKYSAQVWANGLLGQPHAAEYASLIRFRASCAGVKLISEENAVAKGVSVALDMVAGNVEVDAAVRLQAITALVTYLPIADYKKGDIATWLDQIISGQADDKTKFNAAILRLRYTKPDDQSRVNPVAALDKVLNDPVAKVEDRIRGLESRFRYVPQNVTAARTAAALYLLIAKKKDNLKPVVDSIMSIFSTVKNLGDVEAAALRDVLLSLVTKPRSADLVLNTISRRLEAINPTKKDYHTDLEQAYKNYARKGQSHNEEDVLEYVVTKAYQSKKLSDETRLKALEIRFDRTVNYYDEEANKAADVYVEIARKPESREAALKSAAGRLEPDLNLRKNEIQALHAAFAQVANIDDEHANAVIASLPEHSYKNEGERTSRVVPVLDNIIANTARSAQVRANAIVAKAAHCYHMDGESRALRHELALSADVTPSAKVTIIVTRFRDGLQDSEAQQLLDECKNILKQDPSFAVTVNWRMREVSNLTAVQAAQLQDIIIEAAVTICGEQGLQSFGQLLYDTVSARARYDDLVPEQVQYLLGIAEKFELPGIAETLKAKYVAQPDAVAAAIDEAFPLPPSAEGAVRKPAVAAGRAGGDSNS